MSSQRRERKAEYAAKMRFYFCSQFFGLGTFRSASAKEAGRTIKKYGFQCRATCVTLLLEKGRGSVAAETSSQARSHLLERVLRPCIGNYFRTVALPGTNSLRYSG